MRTSLEGLPVSLSERRQIERDLDRKHHIPYSLVDLLPGLRNVQLRDQLNQFASTYKDKRFEEEPEEYQTISVAISEMMSDLNYQQSLIQKVDAVMRAELAYPEADDQYREHFIHPFQTFLLGVIIIDKHYSVFQKWFSSELCNTPRTSVESVWLLASVFHDHFKSVRPLFHLVRSIVRARHEELMESEEIPDTAELIDWMGRVYQILTTSAQLERSLPSVGAHSQFMGILDEYSKKKNHGVLGGLNVLDWIRSSGDVTSTDIVAAMAIALHDGDYENKRAFPNALLKAGIFPIDFSKQPIACLLLWCDAIQEWGRWIHKIKVDTRLVKVVFENNIVNLCLSLDDSKVIKDKLKELKNVGRCMQESDLKFVVDFRIHPAALGLKRRLARKRTRI